jgi:hypothetical protein
MAEEKGGSEIERSVMTEKILSWINEHKTAWRVAVLIVLVVAMMGPWFFDRINVPAQYPCSFRLEGDFCGVPIPGTRLIGWGVSGFVYTSAGLVTGAMGFIESARLFLFSLLLSLLVLPFFSTLLSILRGDRRRRQVFNVVAWGLAVGVGLLIGLSSYPKLYWALWGIWLYIGLAASALILEVLALAKGRIIEKR